MRIGVGVASSECQVIGGLSLGFQLQAFGTGLPYARQKGDLALDYDDAKRGTPRLPMKIISK
jgi:hypothetical protein